MKTKVDNLTLLSIDMKTKVVQHVPRIKLDKLTTANDNLAKKTIRQTRQSGGSGRSLLACLSDFLSSMFVGLYSLPDFLA